MPWLLAGFANLLGSITAYFAARGIAKYAFYATILAAWAALFFGFLSLTVITFLAFAPSMPNGVTFGLGMLPPEFPAYISFYYSTVITKVIYDYYRINTRQLALI